MLTGAAEADNLTSGVLADLLSGKDGNDMPAGGAGDETLEGGGGDDTVVGGAGADLLHGGIGADLFVWTSLLDLTGNRFDRVTWPSLDVGERLDFSAASLAFLRTFDGLSWSAVPFAFVVDTGGKGQGEKTLSVAPSLEYRAVFNGATTASRAFYAAPPRRPPGRGCSWSRLPSFPTERI